MMRKLVVMLMAVLFSLSVSGVSFAQEKPAAKPAEKATPAPTQPCAGAEKEMKKKAKKKAAKKKAAKKEEGATMAPEKPAAPAEKKPAAPAEKK